MEASLTCAVCLSVFEDPVTLPVCSHNFCRHCVVEYLSQAASVALPSSSSSASRPSPRSRDLLQQSPRAPGRPSRDGGSIILSCPLCRKLCSLPSDRGAFALPVNTTLAEVVKLFRAASPVTKPSLEAIAEVDSSALVPQLAALGGICKKHTGQPLQLYCRMCRSGGCGQCVSEDHRGVFHSVNLIDTVYQEEKLAFFSNLKKIRELQLKMLNEISISPKDEKAVMQNEEELIETEFEKLYNALATRKKELLKNLESQKKRKEKEHLIWKNMKEAHRKTIENILIDCENLLDECDPQHFLKVACNLNQRMKTQLELMQMASGHEDQPECKQIQLDIISILKDISALTLTEVSLDMAKAHIPSGNIEPSTFASPEKQWEEKIVQDKFHELRYIHYMKHEVHSDELHAENLHERNTLPKFWFSKKVISGNGLFCLDVETHNQKKQNTQILQRQSANTCSLSNSLGFAFKTQTQTSVFVAQIVVWMY